MTSHPTLLLIRRVTFLLQAVALFVLLLYGLMFLQHAVGVIRFPYQMDYGEGAEIYMVSRLLSGQPLYSDIHQPPYHVGVYSPLYTFTVAPVAALTGVGYGAGRAVSTVLALTIAWLLGRMVYEETRKTWAGIATGLLWLTSHFVYSWAVLMRVDMLALALALSGFYLFWHGYIRKSRERYVFAAMFLFVLAAYARQTSIWAAAACFTYLALTRRWALAVKSLALYAGLGLAILGLLQAATGGEFFRHLVLYNVQVWKLSRWQAALGRAWAMYPLAILGGGLALILAWLRRWPALAALYLLFGWLSTVTTGKVGAYINHLLEASAVTWLACGLLLGYAAPSRRWAWPLLATVALLMQAALLIHLPYSLQGGVLDPWTTLKPVVRPWQKQSRAAYLWTPAQADVQAARALDERVRQTPGLILSEDGSFTTTHGRPMWIQFFDFTQLAKSGVWNQTPFLDQIKSHQFALILLTFDSSTDVLSYRNIITPEMLDALRSSYVLDKQMWLYYVYVPRTAS